MVDLAKIRRKAREQKQKSIDAGRRIDTEAAVTRLELYKEKLLAAAAAALEEQAREGAEVGKHEMLVFSVGRESYGIDIERVEEVVEIRSVTRVPNAPSGVKGIVSVRGTIVAVLDIRRTLGADEAPANADPRLLIVKDRGGMAGLAVDRVSRVMAFDPRELEAPPSLGSGGRNEVFGGIVRREGRVIAVVDPDQLLAAGAVG
jgi:purine-binding chemotaxis protein CheW